MSVGQGLLLGKEFLEPGDDKDALVEAPAMPAGEALADASVDEGTTCPTCSTDPCFCPRPARAFPNDKNAYWTDLDGKRHYWPRLRKDEDGQLQFGCALCGSYGNGVVFHPKNMISTFSLVVREGKLSKDTLKGHTKEVDPLKGDHAKCKQNFDEQHPAGRYRQWQGRQGGDGRCTALRSAEVVAELFLMAPHGVECASLAADLYGNDGHGAAHRY